MDLVNDFNAWLCAVLNLKRKVYGCFAKTTSNCFTPSSSGTYSRTVSRDFSRVILDNRNNNLPT